MVRAVRGGYLLELGPDDLRGLAFIAARYTSARELLDHLEIRSDLDESRFIAGQLATWFLSALGAWIYRDALDSEHLVVPPLASGHLAQELRALYNKLV